jgi:hypothetical protein
MPLKKGYSKKTIAYGIKQGLKAVKSKKQSIDISLILTKKAKKKKK